MASNNKYGLIYNRFEGILNRLDVDVVTSIKGEFTFDEAKDKFISTLKNKFVDTVIVDISAFADVDDMLSFVKEVYAITGDLREHAAHIVIIAPNLTEPRVLHDLVTYHVYNIINVVTAHLSNAEADDLIHKELILNLANPKTFSHVQDLLLPLDMAQPDESDTVEKKGFFNFKVTNKDRLRAYILYSIDDEKVNVDKELNNYYKKAKMFVVDHKPFGKSAEKSLANISVLNIDVLILYRPKAEDVKSIANIINTVDKNISIHVFSTDNDTYKALNMYALSKNMSTTLRSHLAGDFDLDKFEKTVLEARNTQHKVIQETILLNRATVISVIGAKGGVGTTTTSALIAKEFFKIKALKTCVVDYSYFVGDLNAYFGVTQPDKNVFSWFSFIINHYRKKTSNIDSFYDMILDYCVSVGDSGYVLNTPNSDFFFYSELDTTEEERDWALETTMKALKSVFDVVILDVNARYSNMDVALLNSTHFVLVTEPNLPALYRFKGVLNDVLDDMFRIKPENLFVVVNKSSPKTVPHHLSNLEHLNKILELQNISKEHVFTLYHDVNILLSSNDLDVKTTNKKNKKSLRELSNNILPLFKGIYMDSDKKKSLVPLIMILTMLTAGILGGTYWYLYIR